jgi:tRNA(Ile)-lysidine synthase
VRQNLWQTAQILQADQAALNELVISAWQVCLSQECPGGIAFNRAHFQEQSLSVQRGLVRQAIFHLRAGLQDIDFASIERALAFLKQPTRSNLVDLCSGLYLLIEGSCFWIASWSADLPAQQWPQAPGFGEIQFSPPGEVSLENNWRLHASLETGGAAAIALAHASHDPFEAWLDYDRLQTPLFLRSRRPGDRFQSLGMAGHSTKLSDLMINAHLPRRARSLWPLLVSGQQIAWVPGLKPAHPFRLTSETRQSLHLLVARNNQG